MTSLAVSTGQMIGLNERGVGVGEVVTMLRDAVTVAMSVPRVGLTDSRAAVAVALMTQLTGCLLTPPSNPCAQFRFAAPTARRLMVLLSRGGSPSFPSAGVGATASAT